MLHFGGGVPVTHQLCYGTNPTQPEQTLAQGKKNPTKTTKQKKKLLIFKKTTM